MPTPKYLSRCPDGCTPEPQNTKFGCYIFSQMDKMNNISYLTSLKFVKKGNLIQA
jgi:hypothetical protein